MINFNSEGVTPTASFIKDIHTGSFQELLPEIFLIKGAKNRRGFDQAYAIIKGKEVLLIDAVEETYREATSYLLKNGYSIKAILITGKGVLEDAYANLQILAEDSGGAEIYMHPEISSQDFATRELTGKDQLLNSFELEAYVLPGKEGQVVLYSTQHGGILFTGDSALGSDYGSDEFLFTRGREKNEKAAFKVEEFWKNWKREFTYLFPRKGKPALQVDPQTRTTLLARLSRGAKEVE